MKMRKAGNKMATKKIDMERIQEALNDRYSFIQQDERPADKVYYEGMLKSIELMGLTWERKENGKHHIY